MRAKRQYKKATVRKIHDTVPTNEQVQLNPAISTRYIQVLPLSLSYLSLIERFILHNIWSFYAHYLLFCSEIPLYPHSQMPPAYTEWREHVVKIRQHARRPFSMTDGGYKRHVRCVLTELCARKYRRHVKDEY